MQAHNFFEKTSQQLGLETLIRLKEQPQATQVDEFLRQSASLPLLDVRSPKEFAQGHIPGAVNLALFDDQERETLGTLYKQEGREPALARGLLLLQSKSPGLLTSINNFRKSHPCGGALVYCWRGGERSACMSGLLRAAGIDARRLDGGYKTFRRFTLRSFQQNFSLCVLGGKTGSGKTEILRELAAKGQQVLDLEALAEHKGSAFGALENASQPTCEQFENTLAYALYFLNPSLPIWLEDESMKLGRVRIPQAFFQQMQTAPAICLETARPLRLRRILSEYGALSEKTLLEALNKIKQRLGSQRYTLAEQLLRSEKRTELAGLLLEYYDKAYSRQMQKRFFFRQVPFISLEQTVNALSGMEMTSPGPLGNEKISGKQRNDALAPQKHFKP